MSRRRPLADLPWDALSDQPARVKGPTRKLLRANAWSEWLKVAGIAAFSLPGVALNTLRLPRVASGVPINPPTQLGVGISPLDQNSDDLTSLLDDLGCQHVLARFEWRRMHRWHELADQLQRINRPTLAVLVQDRAAVADHQRWAAGLKLFYKLMPSCIEAVQALQAVNRLKWGCATVGESLPLAAMACAAHQQWAPQLPLIGSSVIDFEPLATLRSVVTSQPIRYDAMAALLYVDRRGGPEQTQYGWFDLINKIRAVAAMADGSPNVADRRLWITEVNWPLTGVGKWAPTSQTEAVDEETAAGHLKQYCQQALSTGLVQRVYPWQLIAKGYGLVDPDGLRKRPAFTALAEFLSASAPSPA